jgi:transcriptional regulator with XRE-family HTH domain
MKAVPAKQAANHTPSNDFRGTDEPIPNLLLRSARRQKRWTQQEVAKQIGVTTLSVDRWERGEKAPNQSDRNLLCELFHRSAEELGFPDEKETLVSGARRLRRQFTSGAQKPDQARQERDEAKRLPFQERLRFERELRGWSQSDLAEKVGCDTKTVSRWESSMIIPRPYHRQLLCDIFGKNAEELGLIEVTSEIITVPASRLAGMEASRLLSTRTLVVDVPLLCGDCEQPGITAILDTVMINPEKGYSTFYLRFANKTGEDAGLKFESLSLIDPNGDFFLGQSVGSFLLEAGQSSLLAVIFDWIPQRKTVYKLNIALIRPNKWRNTYRPFSLTV